MAEIGTFSVIRIAKLGAFMTEGVSFSAKKSAVVSLVVSLATGLRTGLIAALVTLGWQQAQAQENIETSCRVQAKEIAVQTYQSCVTQARTQRIQEIRKEYQSRLSDLKSHYDRELKSLAGTLPKTSSTNSARVNQSPLPTVKLKGKSKAAQKGTLPEKLIPSKTLPIQQSRVATPVVMPPVTSAPQTPISQDSNETAESDNSEAGSMVSGGSPAPMDSDSNPPESQD